MPAASCWRPSSTRSRTPYSALVVKIIGPNPTAGVGEGLRVARGAHAEHAGEQQQAEARADVDGLEQAIADMTTDRGEAERQDREPRQRAASDTEAERQGLGGAVDRAGR